MKKLLTLLFILSFFSVIQLQAQNSPANVKSAENIVGTWLSTGDNIAPLLQVIFSQNIDTIYSTFNADNSYSVHQINKDGTKIDYAGTYTAAVSGTGNICTITIEQSTPTVATVEGIFEVDTTASPDFLKYEVVQTSGTQNVPPTPEGGFGSSNGGTLGTTNVQKFVKIGGTPDLTDLYGKWLSTGDNIAPILQAIFSNNVDSLTAVFNSDNTYSVLQVNKDKTVINYNGIYTAAASSTGNIYTITLDQSSPAVLTSEGIFEVDLTTYPPTMKYEVVQTTGTQNVPPTPEGGFGSSNGGALGTSNVQKYEKVYNVTSVEQFSNVPNVYKLEQNYPNPFNPSTKIRFSLKQAENVKLTVYNILGQEVAVLLNGYISAGTHFVDFNANNLASGIYIYKIQTQNFSAVKKMMLLR